MDELAGLLARERLLLELLLFKLVSLRQLLVSGESRFLHWAAEEVERATEKVRHAELRRSVAIAAMAAERGLLVDDLTLQELAFDAPEPWRTILSDHRRAFLRLTHEIGDTLAANRKLAAAGTGAVSEMLERVTGLAAEPVGSGAGIYGPGARWDTGAAAPRVTRTL